MNCVITDNISDGSGGGIDCEYATPVIMNCLIARNAASSWGGGGIAGTALVYGCTIVENEAPNSSGGGVVGPMDVRSSIAWANQPNQASSYVDIAYSDVQGGAPGTGNIDADPLFVDPVAGDYHLQPGSPCIDTADPAYVAPPGEVDLDGQRRVWDGDGDGQARVDMGADEYGSFAYADLDTDGNVDYDDYLVFLAAFGHCAGDPAYNLLTDYDWDGCTTLPDYQMWRQYYEESGGDPNDLSASVLAGDLNCDGRVDFGDINPFVLVLTNPAAYEVMFPYCSILNADINGDGTIGFGDIDPFVTLLSA